MKHQQQKTKKKGKYLKAMLAIFHLIGLLFSDLSFIFKHKIIFLISPKWMSQNLTESTRNHSNHVETIWEGVGVGVRLG